MEAKEKSAMMLFKAGMRDFVHDESLFLLRLCYNGFLDRE